ncbi:MAG: 4-alpha-glucanotransferase [Oscillospiraceae bacterium]|nr:4-alpha-glucanotransferase [Oscillospiraceae bacterium]
MRSSGILMHISSLPGPYGIGTMGKQAFAFVDFLKSAGQRYWQILPLTPTGYGDSPYQSCSTFAGNHYLIDLECLIEDGLLYTEELENIRWCEREEKADFGLLYNNRLKVLRLAYSRFRDTDAAFARFRAENDGWLPDFALFMALKDKNGGKPWYQWEDGLKFREPGAIAAAFVELAEDIQFYCFVQYLFFKQWNALHAYAKEQGIAIIGDVPIYVPLDSVEVWREPKYFQLEETLEPVAVAGCPPDAFTADGQLWGNPLYRWDILKEEGYGWWLRRLAAAGELYDVVRMDHFRGFESYWSVPYGDDTARNGHWVKGPGMDFINAVKAGLPGLRLIAEDLGYLTQEVLDLRDGSGFPGMKVLQFGFDPKEPSNYLPHTYTQNSVCYTGTHDNLTMRQWFDTAEEDALAFAKEYMRLSEEEGYVWGTIRTAFASVSDTVIVPMQDFLNLGGASRMNFPGTLSDSNWTWRANCAIMNQTLANRILALTRLYDRLGE